MSTEKNYRSLTDQLALLDQMQRLIDERLGAIETPPMPESPNNTAKNHAEWHQQCDRASGEREGLHHAWMLLQQRAIAIRRERDGQLVERSLAELMDE